MRGVAQKCSPRQMSVIYDRLLLTTTRKEGKMTIQGKTYQVGDLFTTLRSKVTGKIAEIVPVTPNRTRVKLALDNGEYRWTTVTIK
jgi:hypothetical protein